MGKKNKRKRGIQKRNEEASAVTEEESTSSVQRLPHSKQSPFAFPLPFPSSIKYPQNEFLRKKHGDAFDIALKTSYEGFVVDEPEVFQTEQELVEKAFEVLEKNGFFRVDCTQPFGLGTKCSKTYVTRCLVGEPGTTYKYLGLRMFAHSWNNSIDSELNDCSNITEALGVICQLNAKLAERTRHHLNNLDEKRRGRGAEPTRGRACFNISLINRMESPVGLKVEPSMGEGKCSVSWHADSSLEHFSTIAVYHVLSKKGDANNQWSVGLRVAHNSEGPEASRRGGDISVVQDTPVIAVSLPSCSSYYLLDDFNHHHQHAVIAQGMVPGRRFSSTHRLLRESHNVSDILRRCKNVCSNFHKKGPKVWRSEQLLLTEMESEWLRQFYIQGRFHFDLLWNAWRRDIVTLLEYWSKLEERTKQTVGMLQLGAEGQCGLDELSVMNVPPPPRFERKLREKRRKARDSINELMLRGGSHSADSIKDLYESMAILLEERGKMRELWLQRETDEVFQEVSQEERPLPVPLKFSQQGNTSGSEVGGVSPMPGLPTELSDMACNLRRCGAAFISGDRLDLPLYVLPPTVPKDDGSHKKPSDWPGWRMHNFGLEMQDPWAAHLLAGRKSIETRAYSLPAALIGKRIEILQSTKGRHGVSAIDNTFSFGDGNVKPVGWCYFKEIIEYHDKPSFVADEERHLVSSCSGYGWKVGATKVIYGWIVGEYGSYEYEEQATYFKATRRMRSLFQLGCNKNETKPFQQESRFPKKKKRRF